MPDYRAYARQVAEQNGIDPDIFERQINQESGFDPDAYNAGSGASGIAQIMPEYHDVDVWNPEASLEYAANWMGQLVRQYGSYRKALAAYNWGPGNVNRWDGRQQTLPNETRMYLTNILGEGWPDPAVHAPSTNDYIFPVVGYSGTVNNHWGTSERGGSDIFGNRGDDILVMRGGRVTYAGFDSTGGNNALIKGDDGLDYYYAHLDNWPSVRTGQSVYTGQYLGPLGDTGNAVGTGPHLHIGIGYGIHTGGGPSGGCGKDFDAVGLLQETLDSTMGEDQAVIAELEAQVAALEAQVADLTAQLDAEKSWNSSAIEDTLKPSVEQLDNLSMDDTKAEILDVTAQVSGNISHLWE